MNECHFAEYLHAIIFLVCFPCLTFYLYACIYFLFRLPLILRSRRASHPNLLGARSAFFSHRLNDLYIVMDFMPADLNFAVSCQTQDIPADLAQHIGRQLAEALIYLHNNNIVHGDVKPANILLNDIWGVKLCDFGLAGEAHTALTDIQLPSLWYRPPELVSGRGGMRFRDFSSLFCILKKFSPDSRSRTHEFVLL